MTPQVWLEVFGWFGSALLIFSILQTKFLRFRILNGIASAVLMAYNAFLGVWPAVAMNAVLVVINAYFIVKLIGDRRRAKAFTFADAAPSMVEWFLARHGTDVEAFHPGLADRLASPGARACVLFHEDEAIGLVAFEMDGAGAAGKGAQRSDGQTATPAGTQAELLADYVIPSYRDYAPGAFVYSADGPLVAAGASEVRASAPVESVAKYLRNLGFTDAQGAPAPLTLTLPLPAR